MKVLVVEDNQEKCSAIKRELEKCRISLICNAKTLEDAKKTMKESCKEDETFDLIVTDMCFPESPGKSELPDAGFQLIEFVSSLSLHIPIIICSSGRYPADRENLLGSVHYSINADWETELRKLIGTIPSPPKQ